MRFSGPNAAISATYLPEANLLRVSKTESNVWAIIKDLHKGVGTSIPWILLMDAMAGALIFMGLTGIVLWTRLHGPRIAAVGILFGSAGFALAVIWPTLIMAGLE